MMYETSDPSAIADLGASIAEHAVRLAHLYFNRARMSGLTGDHAAAAQAKARAESLYDWATQATETTNAAGHGALEPQLEDVKTELDSLRLSKRASNAR